MEISNKQNIACFIDSDKILFYQGATGTLIQLDIPPEILSYLDLLQKEKFEELIDSFLEQNKLSGGSVTLIYSSAAAFEKDFEEPQAGKEDPEIQKFFDIVPFEDVLSKTYKLNKKVKAVAVNNIVYESIKAVLERRNFLIFAVIPASILQETFSELAQNMDLGFVLRKIDSIRQFSMINGNTGSDQSLEKKPEGKKPNKRLYVLGGTFAALFLMLIVFIVISLTSSEPEKPSGVITPPFSPKPTILETSENNAIPASIDSSSTPSSSVTQAP